MKKHCRQLILLVRSAAVSNNLLLSESSLKRSHNHRQMFSLLLLMPHKHRQHRPPIRIHPHVGKLQLGSPEALV